MRGIIFAVNLALVAIPTAGGAADAVEETVVHHEIARDLRDPRALHGLGHLAVADVDLVADVL